MVSELRNLTKPAKVIAIVIVVLFGVAGFLIRDTYFRVTTSTTDAQAAIHELQQKKLDKAEYERDCIVNASIHDRKVDKETYNGDMQELKGDVKYLIRLQISKNEKGKK